MYGILQDQVTARVCVEYFTIGHPDVFGTTSPTLLALGWGVLATWWCGLILGTMLALAARVGGRPKLSLRELWVPIVRLLACMAATTLVAGLAGYFAARHHLIYLDEWMGAMVPDNAQLAFLADAAAHEAAYFSGFAGGLAVCIWAWRTRKRLARRETE